MLHKFILFISLIACAPGAIAGEVVKLLDGAVTIELPDGYSRLTEEEMAIKFPRTGRPPFAAFSDARRDATIALTLSRQDRPVSEAQLPELISAMEQMLPRMMAGLVWHRKEIVSAGKRKWARLHMSAHAIDTDVKNDMYFTAFRGDLLGVNLVSTVATWPKAQLALSQAFRRLRVEEGAP